MVEGESGVIEFHSDGSNEDWFVKIFSLFPDDFVFNVDTFLSFFDDSGVGRSP